MSRQVTSDKNYMKRSLLSGHDVMLGPSTSRFSGAFYTRDYLVPHNKGPKMFRAFYEPYRDGRLIEAFQEGTYGLADPPNAFTAAVAPTLLTYIDKNNLTFRLCFETNALAALEFPIYWVIYEDYGL